MPVLELEHLHGELHVDQPAAAGLDVHVLLVGVVPLRLDALARPAHLGDAGTIEATAVDETGDRPLEARSQRRGAFDGTRLDERLALPQLRAAAVIGLERLERGPQRSLVAGGTQAGVDPVGDALAGRGLEHADRALRDAREELVRRDAIAPPARVTGVVDEDEVEIGVVVELRAAELAHGDDREPLGRWLRRQLEAVRDVAPGEAERLRETDV